MTVIPLKLRADLANDPYYKRCAREGLHLHECEGRITWEHALIFGGRRINKRFAIVPLCTKAHAVDFHQDGGDLDKEINVWIALNRATVEELREFSKAVDYVRLRSYLNSKYGPYSEPVLSPLSVPEGAALNY